jgi:hypothetical protein
VAYPFLSREATGPGSEKNAPQKHIEFRRSQLALTKKQRATEVEFDVTPKTRLTGEPIMRILCKKPDNLVGYLTSGTTASVSQCGF